MSLLITESLWVRASSWCKDESTNNSLNWAERGAWQLYREGSNGALSQLNNFAISLKLSIHIQCFKKPDLVSCCTKLNLGPETGMCTLWNSPIKDTRQIAQIKACQLLRRLRKNQIPNKMSLVMEKWGLTGVRNMQWITLITDEISQSFNKGLGRPCSSWRKPRKVTFGHMWDSKKPVKKATYIHWVPVEAGRG